MDELTNTILQPVAKGAKAKRTLAEALFPSHGPERPRKRHTLPWLRPTPWSAEPRIAEALIVVCAWLSRADLKNVRLVCRAWAVAARPTLFHTIFLRIDLESFEKLQQISRDDKLRKLVKNVVYDGRTLAAREGFQDWLEWSAGPGLGMLPEAQEEFISQVPCQELERCHINFHRRLHGQEYILRRTNEKEMLVGALKQLPQLSGIEYIIPSLLDTGLSFTVPPLDSLCPRARKILAEPDSHHGYRESDGHFWTLMQSACMSGHAHQLRTVRGSHLDLKYWNAAAAGSLHDCTKALLALQHLSLEFDLVTYSDRDATTLASMIARAPSLESLRISFDTLSWDYPSARIHLPQVIYRTVQWEHLRRLSLQAVVTTEGCLRSLLKRHATTLRSLELSNIDLEEEADAGWNGHGSWIRFIHFQSETLSLEQIRFDGCFSNMWDEGWVTRDADDEWRPRASRAVVPYPVNCLKFRIERFVTHDGPSPFTARTSEDKDKGCWLPHNLPWVFDEDRSWKFEHGLVQ